MSYKITIEITQETCQEFVQNMPRDNLEIQLNDIELKDILIGWKYVPPTSTNSALLILDLEEKINIKQEVILTGLKLEAYPGYVKFMGKVYTVKENEYVLKIKVKNKDEVKE